MRLQLAILLGILVTLGGCANSQLTPTANADTAQGVDPAEIQLAEAAQSVSKSLIHLDEIQQATTPPPKAMQPPNPASYGMANLVSINWSGPIQPLVEQIAKSTGYKVIVLGKAPAIPVMVSISERHTPVGNILRDVGYQAKDRASVILFPATKTIELRYKNV